MILVLTAAILVFSSASAPDPVADPVPDRRILFIGNSFTFGGNVPEQVRRIAATAAEPIRYEVAMHVRGGTALHEHLAETDPLATIASSDWDVVVLQDASYMPFSRTTREQMQESARALALAAQAQGAQVIYFAHWPPQQEAHAPVRAVAQIEMAYRQLAHQTGGDLARVGRLWLMAEGAGHTLYAEDAHHASVTGAYVAALAITSALGDVDPATASWAPDAAPPGLAALTQNLGPQIATAQ